MLVKASGIGEFPLTESDSEKLIGFNQITRANSMCLFATIMVALNNSIHGIKHDQKMEFLSHGFCWGDTNNSSCDIGDRRKTRFLCDTNALLGHKKESSQKSLRWVSHITRHQPPTLFFAFLLFFSVSFSPEYCWLEAFHLEGVSLWRTPGKKMGGFFQVLRQKDLKHLENPTRLLVVNEGGFIGASLDSLRYSKIQTCLTNVPPVTSLFSPHTFLAHTLCS